MDDIVRMDWGFVDGVAGSRVSGSGVFTSGLNSPSQFILFIDLFRIVVNCMFCARVE